MVGEDVVVGLEDVAGGGGGGDDDVEFGAEAEGEDGAVGMGEGGEVAVEVWGEGEEVAEDRQAARAGREGEEYLFVGFLEEF